MMSGVMVKIGIFGIIKVGVDLLGSTNVWYGVIVLGFGSHQTSLRMHEKVQPGELSVTSCVMESSLLWRQNLKMPK